MISVTPECRINQIAQERLARIGRVGDFISTNIIPKLASSKSNLVNLEIGCGHGHWLTSLASLRKNELFVGIDLLSKRVRKADRKKELALLDNVFFLKAEASEFLEALPKKYVSKILLLCFPTHGPKKGITRIVSFKIPSFASFMISHKKSPNCFSKPIMRLISNGQNKLF